MHHPPTPDRSRRPSPLYSARSALPPPTFCKGVALDSRCLTGPLSWRSFRLLRLRRRGRRYRPLFLLGIGVSGIVCPACNAYLGLAAAGAPTCPRCAAPLSGGSAEAPSDCPSTDDTTDGGHDLLHGGLWLLLGIAVTAGTYVLAEQLGGSRFIVAWGAMLFGGVQFLRGLFAWART